VKRFLELNRVEGVNWQYINEYVPSAKKAGQDRAPTIEEIRRMVDVADLRMKCLVLFLCSSGARIGSVQWLKWRDLEETDKNGQKFAKVTIYRGEPDEYLTFITPECYRVLLEYRKRREGIGEEVAPSSFVFATQGNARDFDQSRVKVASVKTLKNQLGALLQQLGMRTVISEREGYRNYEFKQAHGFRKFFKTRMELAGAKPLAIETMMGHGTGVSKSYYKPTADELASEYAKAIPSLTVISGGVTRDDVDAVKREAALEAMRAVATSFGIDPMKVRVEKKRETGRELTGEEELELIRLEIKKLREPEKDPQKIVQEEELDA
jgi:integrase